MLPLPFNLNTDGNKKIESKKCKIKQAVEVSLQESVEVQNACHLKKYQKHAQSEGHVSEHKFLCMDNDKLQEKVNKKLQKEIMKCHDNEKLLQNSIEIEKLSKSIANIESVNKNIEDNIVKSGTNKVKKCGSTRLHPAYTDGNINGNTDGAEKKASNFVNEIYSCTTFKELKNVINNIELDDSLTESYTKLKTGIKILLSQHKNSKSEKHLKTFASAQKLSAAWVKKYLK